MSPGSFRLDIEYDGSLYAFEPATGKLKWKAMTNGMVHATPAVQNGLAFIAGCDSILRAIRIADISAMHGIETSKLAESELLQTRGW